MLLTHEYRWKFYDPRVDMRAVLGKKKEAAPVCFIDVERLARTCVNCGTTLTERKCKLVCPRCSYYVSCSDTL